MKQTKGAICCTQPTKYMRTNESEYRRLEVAIYDLKTENAELRKDKARMDWIDRTVDGLSRRIVDSEMEDEWLQWDRRQTWLREE